MKSQDKGIKRILKAFTYSYSGFKESYKTEAALRQDLVVFIIGFMAAIVLKVSVVEKILMIFSLILILLMELANTAIETIIDRISDDYHTLSKKAKDIGSLLVLLSFTNCIITYSLIIFKKFIQN